MLRNRIALLILLYTFVLKGSAQDTIYTTYGVVKDVRIRDNQPAFIEYRSDENTKENTFIQKKDILAIVSKRGLHEVIIHDSAGLIHSSYFFIDTTGDTLRHYPYYEPSGVFTIDTSIKLSRFKNDKEYNTYYGNRPHFYINDPDKQFLNCKEITFEGVDFSCMKLVNDHEIGKGKMIKNLYLSAVAERVNSNKYYEPLTLEQKEVLNDIQISKNSYKNLDSISWVTAYDYTLPAGKIPAIIKNMKFTTHQGTGLVFIIEKFVKQAHTISGYWVAFDFATSKTLLMDYIVFSAVGSQSNGYGWNNYWQGGLLEAGIYTPISFQKYLWLDKKGKLELQ